jgi:hypothetical protein
MMNGIRSLSLLGLLLLGGCVSVSNEPALPFPNRPPLTFEEGPRGGACLTLEDANALLRWILELNEYQDARERLLKKP